MATYLICYDLNRETSNYATKSKRLIERLKGLFPTFWHHLDSTWVVVTWMSAQQIRDELSVILDNDDELLVASASGEGSWQGFSERGSSWLKDHL